MARSGEERGSSPAVVLATLTALALALAACGGDGGGGGPVTDACGNRCLTSLGERCNETTGQCYFPTDVGDAGDAGDASDVAPDVPDTTEPDVAFHCEQNGECDPDEYCDGAGRCRQGCRADAEENCADCTLFPDTCTEGLGCSPTEHVCVEGCFRDSDCEANRYCDDVSGLGARGCRDNPDSCPDQTGDDGFACNIATRQCLGGNCAGEADCIDGAYCSNERCFWGCRIPGTDCGTGQVCDPETRTCAFVECDCAPSASDEACDALCDENGGSSALYCNRDEGVCERGCRLFDDGASDNCAPGYLCDETDHACLDGCRTDATCPFMTWCDTGLCATGCKPNECPASQFCDLDTRTCTSLGCADDTACPDGTYCSALGLCQDGCRTDDAATTEVDEDTCTSGLLCDPAVHRCSVGTCSQHSDCPLGQICSGSTCVSGCAGLDSRCPVGQPCSEQTQQCGCIREGDCDAGSHCATPICEADCVTDDPETAEDEDSCLESLTCDGASGRCVAGCPDSAESTARNDVPDEATCVLFSEDDTSDANQTHLCKHGELGSAIPPTTWCDGEDGTYCASGTACLGQDEDWYSFYLYSGDEVSAFVDYGTPESRTFVMVLSFQNNPVQVLRGATPTETGLAFQSFRAESTGAYFLRLFAIDDAGVLYSLRLEVQRAFLCRSDRYEGNNTPGTANPELPNAETLATLSGLSICSADKDFFAIDLFAGNDFLATLDPTDAGETLNLALGTATSGSADLTTVTQLGALDTGTSDANDVRLALAEVPATAAYFMRVTSVDPTGETAYDMTYRTLQADATCETDAYEPNDDIDAVGGNNVPRLRPTTFNVAKDFANARLCPAPEGGATDVDLYRLEVTSQAPGGYLTATLTQTGDELQVEILDESLGDTIGTDLTAGEVTTTAGLSTGYYFVRVTRRVADDALPWYGLSYHLRLEYVGAPCTNDGFENNDLPESATALHTTTLLGAGETCETGEGITDGCTGFGSTCLCDNTESLVACPLDHDWYRFTLLVGDNFTVRVKPNSVSRLGDLRAILYPADCVPGDAACEVIFLGNNDSLDALVTDTLAVEPFVGSGILLEYYLEVTHLRNDPIDYEVLVEVQQEGSRDCPADPWDESDFAAYPGVNDRVDPPTPGCEDASCTLTAAVPNNTRHGQLCFWDQQDWYRFSVPDGSTVDRLVLVEYVEAQGRMNARLWRNVGGNLVFIGDAPERENERGEPAGADQVFSNLGAGVYEIEVYMPGRGGSFVGGTSPNDYQVTIKEHSQFCGDSVWSHGEQCDDAAPVADDVMCGSGGTCTGCTCN